MNPCVLELQPPQPISPLSPTPPRKSLQLGRVDFLTKKIVSYNQFEIRKILNIDEKLIMNFGLSFLSITTSYLYVIINMCLDKC